MSFRLSTLRLHRESESKMAYYDSQASKINAQKSVLQKNYKQAMDYQSPPSLRYTSPRTERAYRSPRQSPALPTFDSPQKYYYHKSPNKPNKEEEFEKISHTSFDIDNFIKPNTSSSYSSSYYSRKSQNSSVQQSTAEQSFRSYMRPSVDSLYVEAGSLQDLKEINTESLQSNSPRSSSPSDSHFKEEEEKTEIDENEIPKETKSEQIFDFSESSQSNKDDALKSTNAGEMKESELEDSNNKETHSSSLDEKIDMILREKDNNNESDLDEKDIHDNSLDNIEDKSTANYEDEPTKDDSTRVLEQY